MTDQSTSDGPTMNVTVVVPTRNSSRTIEGCLQSLRRQTQSCAVVVVDNNSSDDTAEIARSLADTVIVAGPERSAQRNLGARTMPAPIVGFIDSDMYVGATVVADAVGRINAGAGAVIVPERTIGEGYWSSVRTFERSFYEGNDTIEAARFYRTELFDALGGFDEHLTGPEDWDLTMRARERGSVDRIEGWIEHDEGRVRYLDACEKKAHYAEGLRRFGGKYGMVALAKIGDRPYVRHPQRIANRLGVGLVALKLGETAAVSFALLKARWSEGGNSATDT
jgi:arabinofuranan 3-O-arabinosyltransferase